MTNENKNQESCPLCNNDCNQGRECPFRFRMELSYSASLLLVAIVIVVVLIVWSAMGPLLQ